MIKLCLRPVGSVDSKYFTENDWQVPLFPALLLTICRMAYLFFFLTAELVLYFLSSLCLFSFLFPFIFISWRLITSQHCSGFCHTLT